MLILTDTNSETYGILSSHDERWCTMCSRLCSTQCVHYESDSLNLKRELAASYAKLVVRLTVCWLRKLIGLNWENCQKVLPSADRTRSILRGIIFRGNVHIACGEIPSSDIRGVQCYSSPSSSLVEISYSYCL